jgi:ankyrin repeat protein
MDIVPVQGKWHTLAKDMIVVIADELDFYSCDSLRQSCKHYHQIIDHEYWNIKTKQMYVIAGQMDVDLYTKNMIFFCSTSGRPHMDLVGVTRHENRRETRAIMYLAAMFDKDLWRWESGLYDSRFRETLFKVYASDFERDKRDCKTPSYYFGGVQIIRLIFHQTGNINFQNEEGNTLLHCAKRPEQYRYLLQHPDIDVNVPNKKGETPLLYAIKNPIQRLCGCSQGTAPYDSVRNLAMALLEDDRTDIRIKTHTQKTALHYAAKYFSDIVEILIKRLSHDDLNVIDNKGRTPLYLAIKYGRICAVKFLFSLLPDEMKFSTDNNGKTLLHIATEGKWVNSNIIRYLLQFVGQKKNVYVRDHQGKTFLDYLYEKNNHLRWLTEEDNEYLSEEDKNVILSYSFKDYLIMLILRHKKALVLGSLFSAVAYFYMKK